MSEKFTRVFSLGENLYQQGSPIVLEAGDLVKENSSGKIWARLKMRSISNLEIRAVQVRLLPCDMKDVPLEPVEHQYLDLKSAKNSVFCQAEAISFPDDYARSFTVAELEVTFADKSTWHSSGEWVSVFTKKPLTDQLSDELSEQYRQLIGQQAKYVPEQSPELWLCTCGGINNSEEQACLSCGCNKDKVFESLQVDTLQSHLETSQKAKAKRKTCVKIIAGIMAVLVILGVVFAPQIKLALVWHELKTHTYISPTHKYYDSIVTNSLTFYTKDNQKIAHYEKDFWGSDSHDFSLDYYIESIEQDTSVSYSKYIITCSGISEYGDPETIELWVTKNVDTGHLHIFASGSGENFLFAGYLGLKFERAD